MTSEGKLFVREATGLVRELRSRDQFLMSFLIVNVLGGFVFTAILVYTFPGAYLPVVFVMGGIPAIAMSYCYSKMAIGMARSGGDYVWSSRIFGPMYGSVMALFILGNAMAGIGGSSWVGIALGVPQVVFALGLATHSTSLMSAASTISKPAIGYTINLIIFVFLMLLAVMSLYVYKGVQFITMAFYFIGAGAFIVLFASLTPTSFTNAFNHAMSSAGYTTTYASILSTAAKNGFSVNQINWSNTLIGGVALGFGTYSNFNFGTYLAGETKSPKSSFHFTLIVSALLAMAFLFVASLEYYNVFGFAFTNALSYISANIPSMLPAYPSANLLLSLPSPVVGIVISLAIILISELGATADAIAVSRILFAGSFDRLLPSKFSDVSDRFHTPHWAVLLIAILSGFYMTVLWNFGYISGYLNFSVISPVGYALPLIAIACFPYVKPDLYKRTLGAVNAPRGLVSLSAAIAAIAFGFYAFSESFPILRNVYLGSNLEFAYSLVVGMVALGVAIYAISRWRMAKQGVDLRKVYQEIPPE